MTTPDIIGCEGMAFDCYVGFYDHEKVAPQKIEVDLKAFLRQRILSDHRQALTFDYALANQNISEFLSQNRFNLIETLTQQLAQMLLEKFAIAKVWVRVSKFPKDMPNTARVFCECERLA